MGPDWGLSRSLARSLSIERQTARSHDSARSARRLIRSDPIRFDSAISAAAGKRTQKCRVFMYSFACRASVSLAATTTTVAARFKLALLFAPLTSTTAERRVKRLMHFGVVLVLKRILQPECAGATQLIVQFANKFAATHVSARNDFEPARPERGPHLSRTGSGPSGGVIYLRRFGEADLTGARATARATARAATKTATTTREAKFEPTTRASRLPFVWTRAR